jgi:hypothetical protein
VTTLTTDAPGDAYEFPPRRTDRHARVRHAADVVDEFRAAGNTFSAGFCADPACGQFMTSAVHYQPGEPEYRAALADAEVA